MESELQDASNFNPLALSMLLVLGYLTWSLPRRFAACPLLIMTCLMPLGQQLEIFGLHLFLFRILLLVGVLRIFIKGEAKRLVWTRTDKLFVWWVIVSVLFGTMTNPSVDLFRNRLGDAYNAAGCYFFVRCVIVDFEDIVTSVRTLAVLSLPMAVLMLVEKNTAHNLLFVFGGVPEITTIREGHLWSYPISAICGTRVLSARVSATRNSSGGFFDSDCDRSLLKWCANGASGRHGPSGFLEVEKAHPGRSPGCNRADSRSGAGNECSHMVFVCQTEQRDRGHWMAPRLSDRPGDRPLQ